MKWALETMVTAVVLLVLSGCSWATRGGLVVGPTEPLITQNELKALYVAHGFMASNAFTQGDALPRIRRNELQNVLLGMATDQCTEFKANLATRLKSGRLRFGLGTHLFNAAGAVVQHELTAKALSATGAATSALGNVYETTYEVQALNVAMSGIERARTRVF